MKMLLIASALALSTAAFAQDATPMAPPATTNPDAAAQPAGAPDATMPATPAATPDASATPAAAPMSSAPADATATAGSTDDSNLPACSRTVTDKCAQKGGTHASKHMTHKKK